MRRVQVATSARLVFQAMLEQGAEKFGVAVAMKKERIVFDVLTTYLPMGADFFGRDSLGAPPIFDYVYKKSWSWSLFRNVEEPWVIQTGLIAWAVAVGLLLSIRA